MSWATSRPYASKHPYVDLFTHGLATVTFALNTVAIPIKAVQAIYMAHQAREFGKELRLVQGLDLICDPRAIYVIAPVVAVVTGLGMLITIRATRIFAECTREAYRNIFPRPNFMQRLWRAF